MLKKKKNLVLELIEKSQFDTNLFQGSDLEKSDTSDFVITLVGSPLTFTILTHKDDFDAHAVILRKYRNGYPAYRYPGDARIFKTRWSDITNQLNEWLLRDVRLYLEEKNAPDLWEELATPPPFGLGGIPIIENDQFQEEEVSDLRQSLEKYRSEILICIDENEQRLIELGNKIDQLKDSINRKIDYLSEALSRLNPTEWKGFAYSVIAGVVIALNVDTTDGDKIKDSIVEISNTAWTEIISVLPEPSLESQPSLPLKNEAIPDLRVRRDDEQ